MSARSNRTPTVARRGGSAQEARGRNLRWWVAGGAVVAVVATGLIVAFVARGSSDSQSLPANPAAVTAPGGTGELSQLRTPDFHSLAISPADPNIVLYGHHGGVLRSTDGGRTWEKTSLTGATDDAMGMGISLSDPNIAFAAGHGTFFRSSDAGKTWTSIRARLPGTDVHGMAVAPDAAGTLYANVVGFGLYVSKDAGDSWAKANSQPLPGDVIQVSAGPGGRVYLASVGSGVLRSDDGGGTFRATAKAGGNLLTVAASAAEADTVYAGTETRLLASRDGGATWTERALPGGGQMMVSAVNPRDANDLVVVAVRADRAGHVFRSRDGGASWTNQ